MNFVLGLISIEILGMFLVLLFSLAVKYKYSWLEFIAFSFFIGLGCISYFQVSLYFFRFKINTQIIGLIVALALAISLYLYFKFSDRIILKASGSPKFDLVEKWILAGLLAQFLWIIFTALPVPVQSYDSVANFSLKAKVFYFNGGIPAGFFNWSETAVAHPDYPLLLPFYMAWVYHFIGFNDILISKIMPALYLAFLGLFYALMVKFFPRKYSLAAVFCLGTIPQLTRFAAIMYADLALGAFVACGFLYLMLYFQEKKDAFLFSSALLLGISIWIKNEALIFTAVFFISLVINFIFSDHKKPMFWPVIIAGILIFLITYPWLILKFSTGSTNIDINLKALSFSKFLKNLQDIPALLMELQREVFNPKKWNLLWIIVSAVLFWKRKLLAQGIPEYAFFFIYFATIFYFAALILTTSYDIQYHAEKELSRFMLHFCALFIFLAAYLLKDDIKNL